MVSEARTGVCIVRVEAQTHGALITLRLEPDIERQVSCIKTCTAEAETALRIVREFLLPFFEQAAGGHYTPDTPEAPELPGS